MEVRGKVLAGRGGAGRDGAWLVCVACPVPHPTNLETPLDRWSLVSKHDLGLRFTFADEKWVCSELARALNFLIFVKCGSDGFTAQ